MTCREAVYSDVEAFAGLNEANEQMKWLKMIG